MKYKTLFILIILCSSIYAFPVSIENILTNPDKTAKVGIFSANFTVTNSTGSVVYNDISSITANSFGKFKKLIDIPYFGNDTLNIRAIIDGVDTGLVSISYTPYCINSQYVQGKDINNYVPFNDVTNDIHIQNHGVDIHRGWLSWTGDSTSYVNITDYGLDFGLNNMGTPNHLYVRQNPNMQYGPPSLDITNGGIIFNDHNNMIQEYGVPFYIYNDNILSTTGFGWQFYDSGNDILYTEDTVFDGSTVKYTGGFPFSFDGPVSASKLSGDGGGITGLNLGNYSAEKINISYINQSNNYTLTQTFKNITINNAIQLISITLPTCGVTTNGTIARNNSGLYYCNNTAAWSRLG